MGIRCADHVTPLFPQKLALTSPTGGGRSVGVVHSRTKATDLVITHTRFLLRTGSRTEHKLKALYHKIYLYSWSSCIHNFDSLRTGVNILSLHYRTLVKKSLERSAFFYFTIHLFETQYLCILLITMPVPVAARSKA